MSDAIAMVIFRLRRMVESGPLGFDAIAIEEAADTLATLHIVHNSALARAEADAADARRYRWLRSQVTRASEIDRLLYETINDDHSPPYRAMKHGDSLDAAIDAIAQHQEGK